MQVKATIFKDNRLFYSLKESKFFILSAIVLIFGMLIGAMSVTALSDGVSIDLSLYIKAYLAYRSDASFSKMFLTSFVSGIVYILVICLSSFGVCGFPIIPLLLFFKGAVGCAVAGMLYREYSLQGIAFANLILLPSVLVTDFILVYLSNEGLSLSRVFYGLLRDVSARGIEIRPECVRMLRITLIAVVCIAVSAVIESAFSACFIKYFNFS